MKSQSDFELLQRDANEAEPVLAELLERHWRLVLAACRRCLVDEAQAQDAAQEVFIMFWRKRESFHGEGSVAGWLHRTAVNVCRTMNRGEVRRHRREDEAARRQLIEMDGPPQQSWEALQPVIDDCLSALPDKLREAVILCYLEGLSQRAAAKRLGCGEDALHKRVGRGVEQLRAGLRERGVVVSTSALLAALSFGADTAKAASLPGSVVTAVLAGGGGAKAVFGLSSTVLWLTGGTAVMVIAAIAFLSKAPELSSAPAAASGVSGDVEQIASDPSVLGSAGSSTVSNAPPMSDEAPLSKIQPQISQETLEKFRQFAEADLIDWLQKIFQSRDRDRLIRELRQELDLGIDTAVADRLMSNYKSMMLGVLRLMMERHPLETMVWFAELEELKFLRFGMANTPTLEQLGMTLAELEATLPDGPQSDGVLRFYRTQDDPVGEGNRVMAVADGRKRLLALHALSQHWPEERVGEALQWADGILREDDRTFFLGELAYNLSHTQPDETIALLQDLQANDADAFARALERSMRGLVQQEGRVAEVLAMAEPLDGDARHRVIKELSNRWVRWDQEGLLDWLETLEDPQDFDAALPQMLPQLTDENYQAAINSLTRQAASAKEPGLDAALLKAARPELIGTRHRSVEIINRMTQRPEYRQIDPDAEGNRRLLWEAVNFTVSDWVKADGRDPAVAAEWIDTLNFATPEASREIAKSLFDQWQISDPEAATNWMRQYDPTVEKATNLPR